MQACRNGHIDVVQLLLDNSERNIDLNAKAHDGSTAFMIACKNGNKNVVKLLIESSKAKSIDIITGQEELSNEMKNYIHLLLQRK